MPGPPMVLAAPAAPGRSLADLPAELLATIAAFAPLETLARLRRVSWAFRDIVDRDTFLPWRKAAAAFALRVRALEPALAKARAAAARDFTQGTQLMAQQVQLAQEVAAACSRLPGDLFRRLHELPHLPSRPGAPQPEPRLAHVLRFFLLDEWASRGDRVGGTGVQDALQRFFAFSGSARSYVAMLAGLDRYMDCARTFRTHPFVLLAAALLFLVRSSAEVESLLRFLLRRTALDWAHLSDFFHAFVLLLTVKFDLMPRQVREELARRRYQPPVVAQDDDDDGFPPLDAEEFDAAVGEAVQLTQGPVPEGDDGMRLDRTTSIGRIVHDVAEAVKHFDHYDYPSRIADGQRRLTDEQLAVVRYDDLKPGQLLLVLAYAGTGKTSTLVEFARARPRASFLYVAFNRDIAHDSALRFPRNVACRTMHSLALEHVRAQYGGKIEHGAVAVEPVCRMFQCTRTVAAFVIGTVQRFCYGTGAAVHEGNVPARAADHYKKRRGEEGASMSPRAPARRRRPGDDWEERVQYATTAEYVRFASQLWKRMIDPADMDVKLPPEGYLKVAFQQNFQMGSSYDYIFFDEAQDATAVMIEAVRNQRRDAPDAPRKILVGDEHQRIYGWRGAVRDLERILQPTKVLRLTVSFRFDIGIANLASIVLTNLKNESAPLWGTRKPGGSTVVYHSTDAQQPPAEADPAGAAAGGEPAPDTSAAAPSDPMDFEGSQSAFFAAPASSQLAAPSDLLPPQKTTHICRTNHHVLLRAVRVAARDRTSTLGCTISKANLRRIIGQLTDAYYLKKGRKHLMRGPMRQWYNTWADFEKDLEESADAELHTIREVVEDLQGEDAPALLRAVENRMVDDHMSADMIFTSLHKSKGLEFDHVELTNDFIDLTAAADSIIAERTPDKIPNSEALNLVYVAMTRAKHRLGVNPTLATWLEHNHTGSDRWVLRSHDGYCDSCLAASGTFVANESFHPDRAEQLCAGCVGAGGDTGRDPVVRWSLALAGASLSQLH